MLLRIFSSLSLRSCNNCHWESKIQNAKILLLSNGVNSPQHVKSFAFTSTAIANSIIKTQTNKNYITSEVRETLKVLLCCSEIDVTNICSDQPEVNGRGSSTIKQRVDFLIENHVTAASIIENPFLLLSQNLDKNLPILRSLQPKNINDFIPLLRLEPKQLRKFEWMCPNETSKMPQFHLIYYFSEKLEAPPKIICKYILRCPKFFIKQNIDTIIERLDTLLKYIDATYILRDLSVLRSSTKAIVTRMEQVKLAGIESPRPWMIKCLKLHLDRTIKFRLEEKEAKSQYRDVVYFFSEKLELSIESTKEMLDKHPQLYKSRFQRVSKIIDYLLNEANYVTDDIIECPRVLTFSLHTIQKRVQMLDANGIQNMKLSSLVQGSERFRKIIKQIPV